VLLSQQCFVYCTHLLHSAWSSVNISSLRKSTEMTGALSDLRYINQAGVETIPVARLNWKNDWIKPRY
jgi:hypothetical protein